MAKMTWQEKQDAVVAALPETGEIAHNDVVAALEAAGKGAASEELLKLKMRGVIKARVDFNVETRVATLVYSRVTP